MRSTVLLVSVLLSLLGLAVMPAPALQARTAAQESVYLPLLTRVSAPSGEGPLNLSPQIDAGAAVSKTIPLAGGEVVATAANGTRFVLTVPADTLAYTTTVTLTPVAQLSGLPDGATLVGAVQIAPLSLLFVQQPATLRIDPPQAIPVEQELPFAYFGSGQDFHRYPIVMDTPQWVYPITQVQGGYGMAQTPTQVAASTIGQAGTPAYTPADAEAQIRDAISALIQAERARQLNGEEPDPELWPKVRSLLLQYYNEVIQPTLARIESDCDYAEANTGKALGWVRQVQLLFGDELDSGTDAELAAAQDAILEAVVEGARNCYREASRPCMDWSDAEQVAEVLRYYRTLLLLGAEGTEVPPKDLPECIHVDVQLQGGKFQYEFERDETAGYANTYIFHFVDDTAAGVGIYNPFSLPGSPLAPRANYTATALIDGGWQDVDFMQRFFCRDKKAERVEELKITYSGVQEEPPAPPQLYADNIGCWRWTGTIRYDWEVTEGAPDLTYYANTTANVTFERKEYTGQIDAGVLYFPTFQNGKLIVPDRHYRLLPTGTVNYDELWRYVTEDFSCTNSLTLNLTDLAPYLDTSKPALLVPNAGFGAPRELSTGLGSELEVNAPYTKSGDCGPKDVLDIITLSVDEPISADGRRVQLDETGPLGEQSGTYHRVVDLQALRE